MMPEIKGERPVRLRWSGRLTADNAAGVRELVSLLLKRGPFTRVMAYEYRGWEPEVYVGQRVEDVSVKITGDDCYITVSDSYGVWWISTQDEGERLSIDLNCGELRYRMRTPEGRFCWIVVVAPEVLGEAS